MAEPKFPIIVVVDGEPTTVEADASAPLHSVIPMALAASGRVGQSVDRWELRDSDGYVIGPDELIAEFGWTSEPRLVLRPRSASGL
jgi:hypothetical protein